MTIETQKIMGKARGIIKIIKEGFLYIWGDIKGVLYYELLEPGEIITADCYQRQLICLNQDLQRKHPYTDKGGRPVKLLHDNAQPHVAFNTKDTRTNLGWDVLQHPAYLPDIAPSDYHLFRLIRYALPISGGDPKMAGQLYRVETRNTFPRWNSVS